jgi:6-phosphogluconolactonase (cycloisomerase 2 family)
MAALCLTGCKGFWDPLPSSGGGGSTTSSGFFYVLNTASNQLVGMVINGGATAPSIISNDTFNLGATPLAITVAPNNAFLYVSTLGGIFVYTIDSSNGILTLANNGHPISNDPAVSMQVDSTNSWLVEGFPATQTLFAVQIDPNTGLLAKNIEEQVVLPSATFKQIAISPDNKYVLAAMGSNGTAIIPFASGNANPFGAVGTIGLKNAAGSALSVAFDPIVTGATTSRLFYIGESVALSGSSNTGGLRVFDFSTLNVANLNALKELSGSPLAISGLAPYAILPFSTGSYVYVVSRQTSSGSTGVIAGFSISDVSNTLALTPLGSTFAAGTNPQALVEDSSGKFVLTVNFGGNPDLLGYNIDSTHAGYLDKVVSGATGTAPTQASDIAALH